MSVYESLSITATISSMSSTSAIFPCCACTTYDSHRRVVDSPRYASVYVCTRCGHTVCQTHLVGSLCYGCSFEEEG